MPYVAPTELSAELCALLHPDGAAISELLSEGVSLQRALTLYPGRLEDCLAKLHDVLTPATVRAVLALDAKAKWASDNYYRELQVREEPLAEKWGAAYHLFQDSETGVELLTLFENAYMLADTSGQKRVKTRRALESLFDTCWLVCNWQQCSAVSSPDPEQQFYFSTLFNTFVHVANAYITPALLEVEA